MPELPEVETVRAALSRTIEGKTIRSLVLRREGLRVPFTEGMDKAVAGKRVLGVARRGKYLLISLESGITLLAHLGMSGRFLSYAQEPPPFSAHDHACFMFLGSSSLVFNDARRFGLMLLVNDKDLPGHPLLARLGPEPLEAEFTPEALRTALGRRRIPVKQALMDAETVVGVGNIYASEALFEAGIHPARPACEAAEAADSLVSAIRKVLKSAIASGGSSLRDFVALNGETGYFQHQFQVYGRAGKPCRVCAAPVQKQVQGGRSTFYCPTCQKG